MCSTFLKDNVVTFCNWKKPARLKKTLSKLDAFSGNEKVDEIPPDAEEILIYN